MSYDAAEQARRDYERDQQARMKADHEFRTYQERQTYNGQIAWERQQAEERRRREKGG